MVTDSVNLSSSPKLSPYISEVCMTKGGGEEMGETKVKEGFLAWRRPKNNPWRVLRWRKRE